MRRNAGCGIDAHRCDPLPVAVVVRLVAVDQHAHEPALAPAPVDAEVLGQERADDQAGAIVHPSLAAELAHAGVDERIPGASLGPGLEGSLGAAPADRAPVALLELRAGVAGKVQEHVMVEVARAELAAKRVGSLAARQPLLDLARREAAEVQVGGQARCPVLAERVAVRPRSCRPVARKRRSRSRAGALAARERLGDLLLEPELARAGAASARSLEGSDGSLRGAPHSRRGARLSQARWNGEKTV